MVTLLSEATVVMEFMSRYPALHRYRIYTFASQAPSALSTGNFSGTVMWEQMAIGG